jgi:hypothetical protein
MADVDSLSIEIEANAKQAAKNLDALTNSVKGLSRAVSGNSLDNLGKLASSLQNISAIGNNLNGVKNFANAMNRLAKSTKYIDTTGLGKMMSTIDKLGNSLSKVNVSGAARLTGALARLGNAGEKVELTNKSLPQLTNTIKNFATAMARTEQISVEVVQLTSALAKLASAGAKAQQSAASLDTLGKEVESVITRLSKAPQVSANTSQLVYGLGNLASAGASGRKALDSLYGSSGRSSSMLSKLGNIARGTGKAISGMGRQTSLSNKGILGMANSIAMLAGRYWVLIAGLRKGAQAIGSAMDYVETLNYFNNTLDTMGNRANEKWQEIGFSSAEEYASSFRDRAETLLGKMSGFKIGDSGNLEMTGMQNLGVDPDQLMNYSSVFSQMANSLGLATSNASKLGQVLPEIGADMASLYNKDFTEVWDDLQSGITGMARTWDKYGTNIRVANMEQYAATNGLNVNVKTMSQADKVLLRTIMLLDSQRNAWTDLAKTINQPRNQLRMLQASFTNLARSIGSIFMPIVAAVLPYLNAIMIVLNKAANAVANFVSALTGYKPSDLTGSVAKDTGIGDIVEDTEDYGKAANKAAKASKEWKNQLMGFDEINKLEDSSGGDDGGSGGGGGVSGGGGGLQGAFDSILEEYQKAWDKAYGSMSNKAQQMAQTVESLLRDAWLHNDGSRLGKMIADWLNKGIEVAIEIIEKKNTILKRLAETLGTGLNALVSNLNWEGLGTAIGTSIKGQFEAVKTFLVTVDWKNAGNAIAKTLNGFIKSKALSTAMSTFGQGLRSAIQLALGAVTNFDFKGLGKELGEGISNFFNNMNKVDKSTGMSGWQELGKTITEGIKGIATALTTALESVDWDSVGQGIGDFLKELDWETILTSVATAIKTALEALLKTYLASFKAAPLETAIATGLGVLKFTKLGGKLAKKIISAISGKFSTAKEALSTLGSKLLTSVGNKVKGLSVVSKIGESLKTFGGKIMTGIGSKISSATTALSTLGTKIAGGVKSALSFGGTALSKMTSAFTTFAGTIFGQVTLCLGAAIGGWTLGNYLYENNVFGVQEKADKIVEKSGLGKLAVKIADFFEFELPDRAAEFKTWAEGVSGKLVLGFLEKIPDWLQKLLGIDKKVANLKANIQVALDAQSKTKTENDLKNTANPDGQPREADIKAKANTTDADKALGKGKDGLTKDRDVKVTPKLDTKKKLSVNVSANAKTSIDKKLKDWQDYLNKHPLKTVTTITPDGKTKTLKLEYEKTPGANSVRVWATALKAMGGVYKNGSWQPIQKYASGGLPNQGQMFIAREAGAELVGRLGNSTAVMNNDQIVASVAKGVQSAVEVGMRNAIGATSGRNTPQYVQADISIDGRKVMESVLAQARTVSLENNGANVFMSI